ncbi:MAG TPA: flavin reductase family protein [Acidimicrobiales bacterium]|jgi:flavin reductase (DIM6/NTAB) family NADH-FMN oxidoreductase RutF|nr:flavin reductase family protein [Acidimicrobiales bacterium]HWF21082.1 flavin reductase family protein [Acidimicrobiales bacterium]
MAIDLDMAGQFLSGMRPFPVAITTAWEGRTNGLMSLSAGAAGIVPEAPRMTISITKYNFSHDLVRDSGVFAVHLLGAAPELIDASLAILMGLGGSSGRDGDKLAGFATAPGVTGVPILQDALSYVEGRVVNSLDAEENTIFLADVVGAARLHEGSRLSIGEAWGRLPPAWTKSYADNHHLQVDDCRRQRGLID